MESTIHKKEEEKKERREEEEKDVCNYEGWRVE